MKRFKSRSRSKFNLRLIVIFLFILGGIYLFIHLTNNKKIDELLSKELFIKYALNIDLDKSKSYKVISINNKKEETTKKPIVYLYNTHQLEEYSSDYLEVYNIKPTVLLASLILKDYLYKMGIDCIVEEENLVEIRNSMNLKYGRSYQVSRTLLEKRKNEYPTLKYFIDIHRDSGVYTLKEYAKVLFVVGLDHENYEPNLEFSENLCIKINDQVSELCRGVMKKSGKGVNGIYNQDFNNFTILIEIGGEKNKISEVNKTMEVIAKALYNFIGESNEEE